MTKSPNRRGVVKENVNQQCTISIIQGNTDIIGVPSLENEDVT